jgi:hypothetical protein
MNDILAFSPLIGLGCFILAGIFFFVWPSSRALETQTLNFHNFTLHYFHPLAWVLIGCGIIMYLKYAALAIVLAVLGILAFATFLYNWRK